ncbi:MAG: hypothetical protein OXF48_01685 [Bacteroidetes bacterium]|nr:hypothetical protein [Bacteroidota bacterium]
MRRFPGKANQLNLYRRLLRSRFVACASSCTASMHQAADVTIHKEQKLIAVTTADQFMAVRVALCGWIEAFQNVA